MHRAKLKLRLAIAFGGRTALDDIANRTKAEVEATFERGDTDDRARMLVFDLDEHVSQGGSGIEGTLQDEVWMRGVCVVMVGVMRGEEGPGRTYPIWLGRG